MTGSRIAVTGVGIVSALGTGRVRTFERLVAGERGFSRISLFDGAGHRNTLVAEVPDFRIPELARGEADASRCSRSDALALVAAREAMACAGLEADGEPLALAVGVTTGGMLDAEPLLVTLPEGAATLGSVSRLVSYPLSSAADRLGREFAADRVATICSACSSGANALVQGAAWISNGAAERVLAGGTDALCRLTLTGFNALGATDAGPCRPFDKQRAGLTLGEGAAFLVLESEQSARGRGASVLAWFSGWAVLAEAHHITQPDPAARTPARLLGKAMRSAGLSPADIDYVNAHGTGTVANDAAEARALREVFGPEVDRVWVSSSKGQIGHALGAAGALEAAITVLAIAEQRVPPTGGLEEPDDACRLRHVTGRGRAAQVRAALSSSFGFGGTGSVLLFERSGALARPIERRPSGPLAITAVATIGPGGVLVGADNTRCFEEADPEPTESLGARAAALVASERSRRFDTEACLVAAGAEAVLRSAGLSAETTGLFAGTAFGNVERTVEFARAARDKGPRRVAPAEFPHLLPSAASGNASVYLGLRGPVLSTSDLETSAEAAVCLACDWIDAGLAVALIAGSAEPEDPFVRDVLGPVCEGAGTRPRGEGASWVAIELPTRARAPEQVVYAHIVERLQVPLSRLERAAMRPPEFPGRALVVGERPRAEAEEFLTRSGWSSAERRSVAGYVGFHEGIGGFLLAAAAASIFRREADEALVLGQNASRLYAIRLRKP